MKNSYGIQEVKAEIAKTLRKHMEEHEAFLVELYKAHPPQVGGIPFHGSAPVKEKPKPVSPVFHSSAASGIPKSVSHTHPMDAKKPPVGKAACEKCGKSDCMDKCDMSAVQPEVKKEEMDADKLGTNARKASKKAIRSGSVQDFMEASSAHEEASRAFRKEGKHKEADEHESRADSHKVSANTLASAYRMSKSEFDELAAFVSTVSFYKSEDKNVNSGNEKMSSITDKAQGGKGPDKTGSTEEVSEGSGSGGDVLKGKKLGKAAIPMAAPKAPSIPSAKPKAPAAPAAAGPAGTKGDVPAKKSTHNIF